MRYATLKRTVLMGAPALVLAIMPALAQPPARPNADQPPRERPNRPAQDQGGQPPNEWREKYRAEMREHPRIARSLVELHMTKDHLQKAPHDFGGHKAEAIKAVDEAIKQLDLALKFDTKVEAPPGNPDAPPPQRRRGGGGGGRPNGG